MLRPAQGKKQVRNGKFPPARFPGAAPARAGAATPGDDFHPVGRAGGRDALTENPAGIPRTRRVSRNETRGCARRTLSRSFPPQTPSDDASGPSETASGGSDGALSSSEGARRRAEGGSGPSDGESRRSEGELCPFLRRPRAGRRRPRGWIDGRAAGRGVPMGWGRGPRSAGRRPGGGARRRMEFIVVISAGVDHTMAMNSWPRRWFHGLQVLGCLGVICGQGAAASRVFGGTSHDHRFSHIMVAGAAPNCNVVAGNASSNPNIREARTWQNFNVTQ